MITNTATPSPLAHLAAAGSSAWRPRPKIPLVEWCEKNVRLPADTEASPGAFDLVRRPYWREVLEAIDDPATESIAIMKSTQVGGTLVWMAAILGWSELAPAPAMIVTPDRDSAVECRDRLYGIGLETAPIRPRVPPVRDWNNRHLDLASCRVYLAYSGSKQRTRSRPCKRVIFTECDVYAGDRRAGDTIRAGRERVKAFYSPLVLFESSPVSEESPIEKLYTASDRRRLFCCCPVCGAWQELRFFVLKAGERAGRGGIGGLRDTDGQLVDAETARSTAHYICEGKGCRIEPHQKDELVATGRWVPHGQRIDQAGNLTGTPTRGPRNVGFHIWSIHSPTITIGELAAAYVEHVTAGQLAEFFQNWLGLLYSTRKKLPSWRQIGHRLAGTHCRGTIPPGAWFVTVGADIQEDRVKWVARAWGDGKTSWLVDWGTLHKLESEPAEQTFGSDIGQLDDLLRRTWPIDEGGTNPRGKRELAVALLGLDSGYRTSEAHEFARTRSRVRNVRGDDRVKPADRYRLSEVDRNRRTGKRYRGGGLQLWRIYVNRYKQDLVTRFERPLAARGAWLVTSDAAIVGRQYLRELVNEPPVSQVDARGRRRVVFRPRTSSIGVDFWDCEIYNLALADMHVGGQGWDARTWRRSPAKGGNGRRRIQLPDVAARDFPGASPR
jgi:phage terminase large subunit GpA-like protein